jgi:tryptophan synthase alpha chain
VPVCVGFGVSTPAHAREVARFADGVVVGSAIVDRIERAGSPDEAVDSVARFVAELKAATRAA